VDQNGESNLPVKMKVLCNVSNWSEDHHAIRLAHAFTQLWRVKQWKFDLYLKCFIPSG